MEKFVEIFWGYATFDVLELPFKNVKERDKQTNEECYVYLFPAMTVLYWYVSLIVLHLILFLLQISSHQLVGPDREPQGEAQVVWFFGDIAVFCCFIVFLLAGWDCDLWIRRRSRSCQSGWARRWKTLGWSIELVDDQYNMLATYLHIYVFIFSIF